MSASILVVDDEPLLQEAVKCVLHSQGYDVATAGTGEEALTRIAQQAFDVIVSDIKMPGLTGLEVLERSRPSRRCASAPAITSRSRSSWTTSC